MARHLAPAGVDGDWESALASSAVGRKNWTARGSVRDAKGSRVALYSVVGSTLPIGTRSYLYYTSVAAARRASWRGAPRFDCGK